MSSEEPAKLDLANLLFLSADFPLADELAERLKRGVLVQTVRFNLLSRPPCLIDRSQVSGFEPLADPPPPNPRDAALLRAISRRGGHRHVL